MSKGASTFVREKPREGKAAGGLKMKKKRVDSFRDPEKLCKQKQESFEALKGRERQKKS